MIEIINLKKQFKTKGKNGGKTVKTAIDNLSLAINDGEIFGLLWALTGQAKQRL